MIKRNQNAADRAKARKQKARRVKTYAMMFACAFVLLAGLFFAGRQHFSTMDYGMRNSKLRKQIDELEAQKRQLILAREVSMSPAEIKKAAKKTGMIDTSGSQGEVAQLAPMTKEKAPPPQVSDVKSLVVRTVAVTPTVTRIAAIYKNTEKDDKAVKKATMSAE